MNDVARIKALRKLADEATPDNLTDQFEAAADLLRGFESRTHRELAEFPMWSLRQAAFLANEQWNLGAQVAKPAKKLDRLEVLQLLGIERTLHELAYAFTMVDFSSFATGGGSAQTRFYLNSLYHYLSSIFLIDEKKNRNQGFPEGGTIIRVLHPLSLHLLLDRVMALFNEPMSEKHTVGQSILRLRHSYLVHGEFSPAKVEYLVQETSMRRPEQREKFYWSLWLVHQEIILLRLRILQILHDEGVNAALAMIEYVSEVLSND